MIRTPTTIEALVKVAATDSSTSVKSEAFRARGETGGPVAPRSVIPLLTDDDPWVRARAMDCLGN